MSENGLFSSTILDCSVALNDEDNMVDSVKVGLKYGELCYTLSDGSNTIGSRLAQTGRRYRCRSDGQVIFHSKTRHAKRDLRRDLWHLVLI